MKITKYHPKKHTVDIEWQGELRQISVECALKRRIDVFKDIPDELIPELLEESADVLCRDYLLDQIDRYLKPKKGYFDKLTEKGFSKNSAKKAIAFAEEKGLINDLSYAKRFVELNSAKKGRFWLKNQLKNKGVASDVIEEALSDVEEDREELYRLALKLFKGEKTPKEKAALYRKLVSRGFSFDDVNAVINRIFNEDFD